MEKLKFSKQVFFIGAWRAHTVTDRLLRQIETQSTQKKGFPTILNLTADGLDLYILNEIGETTRTDKIPLQNIVDFIDNKYSSTCILAIVKDRQNLYTVFVFLCQSERDAAHLIQAFKDEKNQLSGEGYKVDLKNPQGRNWTLLTKEAPIVHKSENGHIRVMAHSHGTVSFLNGDVDGEDGERTHHISETHVQQSNDETAHVHIQETEDDMKDELVSLSNEVRDIKLMLQKSRGRQHFEQHYGYAILQGSKSPTAVTTDTNERIYDEVAEPQPNTRQTIYQKNTKYTNQNVRPSYTVVREERAVDQGDALVQTAHASNSASAGQGWYTKRRYDSGAEPVIYGNTVQQRRTVKRPLFMRLFKGSNRKPVPHLVLRKSRRGYHGSTVQKNIEHVYGYRGVRRRVPVPVPVMANQRTSEYVQSVGVARPPTFHDNALEIRTAPAQSSDIRAVYQSTKHTSRTNAEQMAGGATFIEGGRFADYEKVQKVVEEDERNAETADNVIYVSYNDDGEHATVDYRQTTGEDYGVGDVTHDETRYKSVNFVHDGPRYEGIEEHDGHIVIPAESTSSVHTTSSTNFHYETNKLGGNVYHVKAERSDTGDGIRTVVEEVDIFDTDLNDASVLVNSPDPIFVKLETENTDDPNEKWDKLPVIVPQKAEIYYDDDGNEVVRDEHSEETRKIVRDSRVVHYYMDELRQSFHEKDDRGTNNDNERNTVEEDNNEGDRKRSYVLDEDALYNSRLNSRIEL